MSDIRYSRAVLVEVLIYHQRTNTSGCHCGWGVLGASYAEHVADVYEESMLAAGLLLRGVPRSTDDPPAYDDESA